MSEALILEFSGVTTAQYRDVNQALGIDPETGTGDWPDALASHTGASSADGLVVFEIWDSREAQGEFMSSRLGPALGQVGVPEPTRVEWLSLEGHHAR
ncbi:MAG: hypothetical protein JWR85_2277 [Marmoricola sp.]|nr:hypothetical protein [Marmoricola sp.]